jgi:hypothetical protein
VFKTALLWVIFEFKSMFTADVVQYLNTIVQASTDFNVANRLLFRVTNIFSLPAEKAGVKKTLNLRESSAPNRDVFY